MAIARAAVLVSALCVATAPHPLAAAPADPSPPGARPAEPSPDVPFLRRWLLAGPFLNADDGFLDRVGAPETALAPKRGDRLEGRPWVEHRALTDWVYPEETLGRFDWAGACAVCWLHVREAVDAVLWIGHDDSARVYLDGVRVHDHHFHAPLPGDGASVPVRLSKGAHRLLVKVEDVEGDSGFALRIARRDGGPAPLLPSLSADGIEAAQTARAEPGFFPVAELARLLPVDPASRIGFDDPASLGRVSTTGPASAELPAWLGFARAPGRRGPPPGFSGALVVHPPLGGRGGARIYWKTRIPAARSVVTVRASGETGESHGRADALLRIGAVDESGEMRWLAEKVVGGHAPAWDVLEARLAGAVGDEVLLVLEAGYSGEPARDDVYVDSIEVR